MMIFPSSGIVLRHVKYGDSSAVVSIYSREFGLQSYMVNGVRSNTKGSKTHLYQPASILEMQVYHNSLKNLQRIREAEWKIVYRNVYSDVARHTAALLMVELMQKTISHEEQNKALYDFAESMLVALDALPAFSAANVPLLFAVRWPSLLGFQMRNNYSVQASFFDVREGAFTGSMGNTTPENSSLVNQTLSSIISAQSLEEMNDLNLNGSLRRKMLLLLEQYFKWHIDGFRELNTLKILG